MQINLKQAEITEALKEYVGGQGINLKNKSFTVTYTAGRKESGLLADISIENIETPETAVQTGQEDPAEKKSPENAGIASGEGGVTNSSADTGSADASGSGSQGVSSGTSANADASKSDDAPGAENVGDGGISDRPLGQLPSGEAHPNKSVKSLFGN